MLTPLAAIAALRTVPLPLSSFFSSPFASCGRQPGSLKGTSAASVRELSLLGVAMLAGLISSPAARADAIATQQLSLLQQFNLIDLGSLATSSEIEGRAFVAGDESGQLSNIGFNNGLTASSDGYATLTVNGSVNGNINVQTGNVAIGGNLNGANLNGSSGTTSQVGGNLGNLNINGGTLQYSGAETGNVNANGGATVQQVANLSPGIASSTFDKLNTLSSTLDGLQANSTVTLANNTATFNAVANANGQAIFEVSSSVFAANQFQFNLNGASSAIINVDGGGSINADANFLGGAAQALAHELLWNFNSVSSLNVGAEFGGTILAIDAQVSNSASIDGTLVADGLTQSGELHSYDFLGTLPGGSGNPTNVPEPPTLAVLTVGLLGLIAVRRKSACLAS